MVTRTLSNYLSPNVLTNKGLSLVQYNPTFRDDPNFRRVFDITARYIDPADPNANPSENPETRRLPSNPNFSTLVAGSLGVVADWGANFHGGGTNAKATFEALGLSFIGRAAGQKILQGYNLVSSGMGDNAIEARHLTFDGGPINGDEGTGLGLISTLQQKRSHTLTAINSVERSTLNTTLTQAVVADIAPQTVSVASSVGAAPGHWLSVGQAVDSGTPNIDGVQVISVPDSTHIRAIFNCNQPNGAIIKPCLVLNVDDTTDFGEQRTVVNLDGVGYSTGSITGKDGGALIGTGTDWSEGMLGGDSLNIAAISLDADTKTVAPWNGVGVSGPLRDWYNVTAIINSTRLSLHSYSVAGDTSYQGYGPGGGGYLMKPAVRVLRVPSNTKLVCEYTSTVWEVGNNIECVKCPYPDVSVFQYYVNVDSVGGTRRAAMKFTNLGFADWETGYALQKLGTGFWNTGVDLSGTRTGLAIRNAITRAILLDSEFGGAETDNAGLIDWNGGYVKPTSANLGMDFQMIFSGNGGLLSAKSNSVIGSGNLSSLRWTGMMAPGINAVADLPTPSSSLRGMLVFITNSNTDVPGAPITGTGAFAVLALCTGAAWNVLGA